MKGISELDFRASCSKIWKIFLIFYDRNIREIEREVLLTFIFKVDSKLEIRKWRKEREKNYLGIKRSRNII